MNKKISFLICLITFSVFTVYASYDKKSGNSVAEGDPGNSFRLFEDEELLEITLKFDLTDYIKNKPAEEYLKARITFHINDRDSINGDIRLRTRGIYRNEFCYFPPIELNFKNADFGYSDLDSISRIKVVPACNKGKGNENYVLREYLVYKLYNLLSDNSFRVRLLKINYIDSENKKKPITQFGFFIEPVKVLASRTNSLQIRSISATPESISQEVLDRVAIFNYMIGNYDWSVPGPHNVRLFRQVTAGSPPHDIAVPYDFDWTGLVNAHYAIPEERLGIKSVRERIFRGLCRSEEVYRKDLEVFAEKKEEFFGLINEFPYLSKRDKKDIIMYLGEFYRLLDNKMQILEIFRNSCR